MKKILLFLILCFISFPNIVLAADYKVCEYVKNSDKVFNGALHVVGDRVKFDMYRSEEEGILKNDEFKGSKLVYSDGSLAEPKLLLQSCPLQLCEENGSNGKVLIQNNCRGAWVWSLQEETTESAVSGLNEAIYYQYGDADPSKISGMNTILNGGCPTDEGIFKLLKVAYDLIKIAAPVMVALFATIDLAKAAAASDDSAIKKAQKHCMKRIAAAVVLFLSFSVVEMFVKMVSGGSEIMSCISSFLN